MQFQAQDHVSQNHMFLSRSMPLGSVHPFLCLHSQSLQMFEFTQQPSNLFFTLAPCCPPPRTCDHRGFLFNLQLHWRNSLLSRKALRLLLCFCFFGALFASTVWHLHTYMIYLRGITLYFFSEQQRHDLYLIMYFAKKIL